MVTEKELRSRKYTFKHIQIDIIEKDENDNVHVFCGTYVKASLSGGLSEGHMEINKTLWDQGSNKRPPGYWVLGGSEENGVAKSYLVSEEWLDNNPKEVKNAKRAEWKIA